MAPAVASGGTVLGSGRVGFSRAAGRLLVYSLGRVHLVQRSAFCLVVSRQRAGAPPDALRISACGRPGPTDLPVLHRVPLGIIREAWRQSYPPPASAHLVRLTALRLLLGRMLTWHQKKVASLRGSELRIMVVASGKLSWLLRYRLHQQRLLPATQAARTPIFPSYLTIRPRRRRCPPARRLVARRLVRRRRILRCSRTI